MTIFSFLLGFAVGVGCCTVIAVGAFAYYLYIEFRADELERADQDLRRSNNTSRGAAPL